MSEEINISKRTWIATTCAVGGAGVAAVAVPFVSSFQPSEKAKAAGAPVEVDIADLQPGQMKTVEWRGKPIWVIKRTEAQLAELDALNSQLADPKSERNVKDITPMASCQNVHRSIKKDILVVVGICTHLGCSPTEKFQTGAQPSLPDDWKGGFLCPCHGSTFDMAGRVFKNKPAPDNLPVPPHMYVSDTKIIVGQAESA